MSERRPGCSGDLLTDSVRLHLRSGCAGRLVPVRRARQLVDCLLNDARSRRRRLSDAVPHCVSACYDAKGVDGRPFMEAVIEVNRRHAALVLSALRRRLRRSRSVIAGTRTSNYGSTSIFAQWCVLRPKPAGPGSRSCSTARAPTSSSRGYHSSFPCYFASLVRQRRFGAAADPRGERAACLARGPLRGAGS